jgi:polysaccharide pyruvyl transferase WcaK-like protein
MNESTKLPHWRIAAVAALLAWSVTLNAEAADASFPLRVSANGHYLEDAGGKPFLLHGDTAWSLIVQLTKEETEEYLENRRQKGVNSIIVNLIEAK